MGALGDFIKMLLLLMLSKMLASRVRQARSKQLILWFDALSQSIAPVELKPGFQFQEVMSQIQYNINTAMQKNKLERPVADVLSAAFNRLKHKHLDTAASAHAQHR